MTFTVFENDNMHKFIVRQNQLVKKEDGMEIYDDGNYISEFMLIR